MMNILASIKGRVSGLVNEARSHYWDYIRYYEDGVVWGDAMLFESFNGKNFQGNPYYLYRCALQAETPLALYIAHRDPEALRTELKARGLLRDNTRIIQKDGPEYRNVLSHAKYLINNVSFPMDWIKKEGQIYLNTWHGTALKCLGRSIKNDAFELHNSQRNMLLSDLLLAPNAFMRRVFLDEYMLHGIMPGEIVMNGYPRNTAFFDAVSAKTIRKQHGLEDKTAIFYMPTWRGTASGVQQIDFVGDMEKLADRLGDRYAIYVKLHPAMLGGPVGLKRCRLMPEAYEVYEFLNAMDILITDYSSVYFDFANAGKRILLYQTDRSTYFADRGFYAEPLAETPYPVAETLDELEAQIVSSQRIDDSAFREKYCACDHETADAELLDMLLTYKPRGRGEPVDLYVIDFPVTDEQLLHWKDALAGTNYRFVLVPRRSNHYFHNVTCLDRMDYLICFDTKRILPHEMFQDAKTQPREKRRLWGDLNVGRVYARGGRLPLALRTQMAKWPDALA